MGEGVQYKPGDVVNGYVLTEHDGWQPALPPRRKSKLSPWGVAGLALLVLVLGAILLDTVNSARNLSNAACVDLAATVEDHMAARQRALLRVSAATNVEAGILAARQADDSMLLALRTVVEDPQCFDADDVSSARAGIPVVQSRLSRY